jgi:hypothetical protein
MFGQLDEKVRRSQEAQEAAEMLRTSLSKLEEFSVRERRLTKLGRLAEMPDAKASEWAGTLVRHAKRMWLKATSRHAQATGRRHTTIRRDSRLLK